MYLLLQSNQFLSTFFVRIIAFRRTFRPRATGTTTATFHAYHASHWFIRNFCIPSTLKILFCHIEKEQISFIFDFCKNEPHFKHILKFSSHCNYVMVRRIVFITISKYKSYITSKLLCCFIFTVVHFRLRK